MATHLDPPIDTETARARAEPQTMAELLAEAEAGEAALQPLRAGELVVGTVASVGGDLVLVDLGGRPSGEIAFREPGAAGLVPGDRISAIVIQPEGPRGHAVLSLRQGRRDGRWDALAEQARTGAVLRAPVTEANRGGVVVDVGLRGFVPLSQLSSVGAIDRPAEPTTATPEALRAIIGQELALKVIEVDAERNRLILSEKAAAQELRRQRKARAATELSVGEVREGVVTEVTGFGLFVDIGVADGLVHRSEITWDKSRNPIGIHTAGDRVTVMVTAVDPARDRISLSIKRQAADPWSRAAQDLAVGRDCDATITRLMPFGAFARVADGLEGLIHISELAGHRVATTADAVQEGDHVRVRVVSVDLERRRLSLSIRQADAVNATHPNV